MMLARVADSLYWIGRYIERAEHLSRLSDVMLQATLDQSEAAAQAVHVALAAVGEDDASLGDRTPFEAARDLVLNREDYGSVVVSLARARENARQVRDQITTETWERLNLVYLRVTDPDADEEFAAGSSAFLHGIVADLHLFKGAADATMSHGEGWRFLLLGVYLERAQLIARLLEIAFGETARPSAGVDHLALVSILRMGCALEPYLRVYTADIQPRHILEFLLFDEEFPRSIRFATARIEEHLTMLTRRADAAGRAAPERLAGRLSARLEFADPEEVMAEGAGEILSAVVGECASIHEAIYSTFVAYPLEQRLPA
ncbi:MAG TPA: alpha-E domain-containing protein [Caulobacteraceae bacterium]|nr:alpha-E domain-containing protein [Caulobacteraceae bacterium]